MNLMDAILVSLWAAGWTVAAVRAGLKARGVATVDAAAGK